MAYIIITQLKSNKRGRKFHTITDRWDYRYQAEAMIKLIRKQAKANNQVGFIQLVKEVKDFIVV
jgi:hypothetical protein